MSDSALTKLLTANIETLEDRVEILEEALYRIKQWADAYPLEVFPEVDEAYLRRASDLFIGSGMTIDRINASTMRHVVEGVGKIAREALEP